MFRSGLLVQVALYLYVIATNALLSHSHMAKIIVTGPAVQGMGHIQVLSTLIAELVQRDHNVTLLSGSEQCSNKFAASNASQIINYRSPNGTIHAAFMDELADVRFNDYNMFKQIHILMGFFNSVALDCRAILSDQRLLDKLKSNNFDILIGDAFSPCDFFIAHILDIPWIAVTSNREYVFVSNAVYGIPAKLSYIPATTHYTASDDMTFLQRVENFYDYYIKLNSIVYPLAAREFIDIKNAYNIAPDMNIWEMSSRAELWLSQSSLALDFPSGGLPNYVPIGGSGVRPSKTLPKDLEAFVEGSGEHGFILFSLGSIIKWLPDAPETRIITSVLSRLPQRVVWKHDGPRPLNIGSNVKLMKWLPQNDLLGHPKARLYIGHGGLNGVYEALYHAVPMVIIPLMLDDQKENAARVAHKGMGIHLDRSTLTDELFMNAVAGVLNDTSYKSAVTHYSKILRHKPPLETAVYWIEHVLEFGGAHLRPNLYHLNFFQYHLIDVVVFLISIVLVAILLITYGARLLCWRKCLRAIDFDSNNNQHCNSNHIKQSKLD